ncbi:MAG: TOMM precursor leader peptide-binding protein [Gemmatimonadaceae bacterium]
MDKIRLSPFMAVIPAGSGVFVRSDLKSFALSGEGVAAFVRRALPLLDGRHNAEAIANALPDYSRKSTLALLGELEQLGIIEFADGILSSAEEMQHQTLAAFFRHWGPDPQRMCFTVAKAHVAIVGMNDWSAVACEGLVRSGVGRLTVLDVTGKRRLRNRSMTAARLVSGLRRFRSSTTLSRGIVRMENGVLSDSFDDVTLLLVTANADELQLLDAAARMAEARQFRYMVAHLEGLSAILGPVVIPGETACWECLRHRRLANEGSFGESAALQAALMSGETAMRQSLTPPGAASFLGGLIALEAIKVISDYAPSQLVGRQLEFNLVTYDAKMHGLVRLPWCTVCGGAAGFGDQGPRHSNRGPRRGKLQDQASDLSASREPADLREALAGWVDNRTGIVQHLVINDPSPEQPQSLATTTAIIAAHAVPGHRAAEPLIGSGKHITKVGAMIGAAGEAIERYSASIYRESDLLRASPVKLGRSAFDPVSLSLYLPEQYAQSGFSYDRFDAEKEISWTEGIWLDSGKKVFVPALPTYFNYRAPRTEQFCQVTSNGLAAGGSFEDAALRATMELIERDAFMMTWLQRRPPQRIEVGASSDLGEEVFDVLSELRELGMDTQLYLMKGDVGISSVMCVAWGDGKNRPSATVALAAHFDPVEAVRKAILEQAHIGPYIARLMADASQPIPRTADDVQTLIDHALYYVPRRRLAAFDFIRTERGRPVPIARIKRTSLSGTEACIAALADGGFRVAVADVTAPDVELGPFRVARALGMHLQPIDFGHRQRRLANPRLFSNGHDINPDPHPLA